MGYLVKQNNILTKLKETNYELFDGDKEEALTFLENILGNFPEYTNIVIKQQVMLPIWQHRYEGQEYRDKVEDLDARRKTKHDVAIGAVSQLNRISSRLGLEPFADIDTSDRYAVADFIGTYVNEVYNNGIGKTMDSAAYQKTTPYDTGVVKKKIRELPSIADHENTEAIHNDIQI